MANWELFDRRTLIAGLNGSCAQPILYIGKDFREAGFDENLKYELLFDRASLSIGLNPSLSRNGYSVRKQNGQRRISLRGFCSYFGLNKKYRVESYSREGDMWILPLLPVHQSDDLEFD